MIEEVRRLPPCSARTEILAEAVKLLKTGIQKINLPVICQLLYEGKNSLPYRFVCASAAYLLTSPGGNVMHNVLKRIYKDFRVLQ